MRNPMNGKEIRNPMAGYEKSMRNLSSLRGGILRAKEVSLAEFDRIRTATSGGETYDEFIEVFSRM